MAEDDVVPLGPAVLLGPGLVGHVLLLQVRLPVCQHFVQPGKIVMKGEGGVGLILSDVWCNE